MLFTLQKCMVVYLCMSAENQSLRDFDYNIEWATKILSQSERQGYVHSPKCVCCSATSPDTHQALRPIIDAIYMTNPGDGGTGEIAQFLLDNGYRLTLRSIQRHLEKHSPYTKLGLAAKKVQQQVALAVTSHVEAEHALQNIVNIGNEMIKSGEMPVTERLYAVALKELNKKEAKGQLDDIVNEIEERMYNRKKIKGEAMEGETVDES